jgi:hypothetical protein
MQAVINAVAIGIIVNPQNFRSLFFQNPRPFVGFDIGIASIISLSGGGEGCWSWGAMGCSPDISVQNLDRLIRGWPTIRSVDAVAPGLITQARLHASTDDAHDSASGGTGALIRPMRGRYSSCAMGACKDAGPYSVTNLFNSFTFFDYGMAAPLPLGIPGYSCNIPAKIYMTLPKRRRSQDRRRVAQPIPGWVSLNTARDHMNPRSSTQPLEGDSRRTSPAVRASQGGIVPGVVLLP